MHIKKNDLFYQRQFHAVIVLLNTYVFIGTALICINMVLYRLINDEAKHEIIYPHRN